MRGIIVILLAITALIAIGKNARADAIRMFGPGTWYGNESGSQTTSGQRFDERGETCAMPHFRRGMPLRKVRVTVVSTGRSAVCRVNDRGPAAWTGAVIDVSKGIARQLGTVTVGRFNVRLEWVD